MQRRKKNEQTGNNDDDSELTIETEYFQVSSDGSLIIPTLSDNVSKNSCIAPAVVNAECANRRDGPEQVEDIAVESDHEAGRIQGSVTSNTPVITPAVSNSLPEQEVCPSVSDPVSEDYPAEQQLNPSVSDPLPVADEVISHPCVSDRNEVRKILKPSRPSTRAKYQVDLKKGDKIQFKLDEGVDNWIDSKVINRCLKGKRKGEWFACEINKKQKVYNLAPGTFIWRKVETLVDDSEIEAENIEIEVDHAAVHDENIIHECLLQSEEVHEVYAVKVPYNQHHLPHVVKAKNKEHTTLIDFNTYEEVREDLLTQEQRGNMIGSIWVVVNKELMGETVCKARICCRGDMETIEIKTDSPTISKPSERLLLTVAASKGYKLQSLDFKAAFLQGKTLEREVIVVPPKDLVKYENGKRILWRLNKSMYGLVDAARNFNREIDTDLLAVGCVRCTFDKALYFYYDGSELIGILSIHVDDICFAGNTKFYKEIIERIVKKYTVGRIESDSFNFTGWNLRQDSDGIVLTQQSYLEKLSGEDFTALCAPGKEKDELLDKLGQKNYRKAVGSLGWVAQVSRPDLAYSHMVSSTKSGKATVEQGRRLARMVNKLSETKYEIRFSNLGKLEDLKLVIFEDASPANKHYPETVISNIEFLGNSEGKMNIIDWKSKKLDIPSASPLGAEAEAAIEAFGKVKFMKALMMEMLKIDNIEATIVTDSKSLKQAVESDNLVKDKRTAIAVCTLRKCKEFENIGVDWVEGENQLADILTKPSVNPLPLISVLQGNIYLYPNPPVTQPMKAKKVRKSKKQK